MNNTTRYPASVFWSDEDKCFIATVADLPGCSAGGDTQAEALAELEHAISAWIEAAKAVGNSVPAPTDLARKPKYSGRLVVRMPIDLHAKLAGLADTNRVSLNQFIVYQLAQTSTVDVKAAVPVVKGSLAWQFIGDREVGRAQFVSSSDNPTLDFSHITPFRASIATKVTERTNG